MKNRRLFISIFAMSLAVTLLVSPVKVFNNPVVETIQVQAEEEPITDTQRGVALLMTIMLAQGLRFVGDWNTVVQPGLQKLWDDFSTATGNAVTLPMIVAGSSLALGYIRTSNTVNNAIANFMTWYKQTFDQPVTGDVSIPVGTPTYGTFPVNSCVNICTNQGGYTIDVNLTSEYNDIRGFFMYYSSGSGLTSANKILVLVNKRGSASQYYQWNQYNYGSSSSCVVNGSGSRTYDINQTVNNVLFSVAMIGVGSYGAIPVGSVANFPVYNEYWAGGNFSSSSARFNFAYSHTFGDSAINDLSMEGQSLELKDGYQLESDQAKLYDIAGLEALVASLALTLENIDDLVRDIPLIFDTPWAEDFPDVPAYVDTPDDTIPWVDVPDSVIPADTPEYVPTIPSERDEYKVLGLEQVFPFSIPFDLYYLSQILVSEPQTPEFQYAAVNPVNGQLLTVDVDLHDFDGVASIFRTCEIVLFIAFLIWITRSLIRS